MSDWTVDPEEPADAPQDQEQAEVRQDEDDKENGRDRQGELRD